MATLLGGKQARRLKLTDFLLTWGRKRKQTGDEQLALLRAFAARQGSTHDDDR